MARTVDSDLIVIVVGKCHRRTRHASERASLAIDRESAKSGISNLHSGAEGRDIQHIYKASFGVSSDLEQVRLPHAFVERRARNRRHHAIGAVDGTGLDAARFEARSTKNKAAG